MRGVAQGVCLGLQRVGGIRRLNMMAVCPGWLVPGGGAFVPRVYPREALFGDTVLGLSVVVQNFSEIVQFAAE